MTGSSATSKDPVLDGLDVYIVGGAVRDALLGLPAGDRDWVVVGATPQQMLDRGFTPVGGDFPVFLHPHTKEEYALARTERKFGRGYQGFVFHTGVEVTLEDDLRRRDLTVNAMAQAGDGRIVDPLGGLADLQARCFRHVGPAFEEDPVRILRLARFAARFPEFSVAPETLVLCQAMVRAGEADALVPERVWKELSRGLMASMPARMLDVLIDSKAAPVVLPGWHDSDRIRQGLAHAAAADLSLPARYAWLCLDTPEHESLDRHLKVPRDCADFSRLLAAFAEVGDTSTLTSARVLDWLERCDVLRKPERFEQLLHAAQTGELCSAQAVQQWQAWGEQIRQVDAAALAAQHASGDIRAAVREARLAALVV